MLPVVGRWVEAGEEVVEGLRGDGEGVGVVSLVAFAESAEQFIAAVREADEDRLGACFAGGLFPGVALGTAPQPVVQDDVVPRLQLFGEALPDRLHYGAFALEAGVLGVVHAVPAVETVHSTSTDSRM